MAAPVAFKFTVNEESVLQAIAASTSSASEKGRAMLNFIGQYAITYLRSFTAEMRPPARGNESPRPAHPGHWADIRGTLALGFRYEISVLDEDTSRLALLNDVGYAIYLENREGYWVLKNVTEPGGPVENALREAIRFFPEFKLREVRAL